MMMSLTKFDHLFSHLGSAMVRPVVTGTFGVQLVRTVPHPGPPNSPGSNFAEYATPVGRAPRSGRPFGHHTFPPLPNGGEYRIRSSG